jgi:hypothetical protein
VRGVRPPREVTRRTFDQRELRTAPGSGGDALRALQNFPGIARPPGLAGLLIVRGSAPQDTNIFVDGTLVPIVYHFGGLSSVIPTEALEKIDFYPGNFSAQYGRVQGGIIDVGVREPRKDKKFHGLAQVDLIDVRLLAEGPLPFGEGWTFLAGGRRSHFGETWAPPVFEALNFGISALPKYYDYQLMVNKEWNSKESLRFMFFGSDDRFESVLRNVIPDVPGASGSLGLGTAFYRFQARYRNRFNDNTELKVVAAGGKDAVAFGIGDQFFKLDSYPITMRVEGSQRLAKSVTANIGMDWLWQPYDIQIRLPPPPRPGEPPAGPFGTRPPLVVNEQGAIYRPGFYSEFVVTPWVGGRLIAGARADYSKDIKRWDLSPRLAFRQDVVQGTGKRTTLKGGLGIFRQPPQPVETNGVFGVSGLSSNQATHYSLGVEREFSKNIELSVEGFYRDLDNQVVARVGNTGTGKAFGAETLLRYKPDDRFFGFLAYTLSRSTRRDFEDGPERPFQYDQTHILTALASYRFPRGWEVGARYRIVSGSMTTPRQYGFFDASAGSYIDLQYPTFGERLPLFHQLDIRIEKTWEWQLGGDTFGSPFKLAAYLDVLNTYYSPNVEGRTYNYNTTRKTDGAALPFLPIIGVRGEL